MTGIDLGVHEIKLQDVEALADYWTNSDPEFLISMGVDITKMPERNVFFEMIQQQINQEYEDKKSYAIIWTADNRPIGHSNVNKIIFGEEASMHLHIWDSAFRKKGIGSSLLKMTLPFYYKNLKLKKLLCEPYALNPAPNNTLKNIGFSFVKRYRTVPGQINFEQDVNRWELSRDKFMEMNL